MCFCICIHIMDTLCSIAAFYNLSLYSNDGLCLTSWCVYSRGQSKLQACGEVVEVYANYNCLGYNWSQPLSCCKPLIKVYLFMFSSFICTLSGSTSTVEKNISH